MEDFKVQDIDIYDFFKSIIRHKIFIIVFVTLVSIGALTYSLVTPEKWSSSAVIEISGSSTGGLAANFSGLLGSFASSITGMTSSEDIMKHVFLMNSRTFSEKIIKKHNLINYFEIEEDDKLVELDEALKKMKKIRNITLHEETNYYVIDIKTKDKQLSKDIVLSYIDLIKEYNLEDRVTKGRNLRKFLEKRVNQINDDIDILTSKIKSYNDNNNIILIEEQGKTIIENYAKLVSQKNLLEVQRDYIGDSYGTDHPEYISAAKQIELLSEKITSLESSKDEVVEKYMLPLDQINGLAIDQKKWELELEVNKQIIETVYPQYELAKLQELNDVPAITIIENPKLAGLRTEPKRALICIISFLAAIFFSSVLVFIYDMLSANENFKKMFNNK
jgi:uncharacterized protein involved in exopolysaccharide biosynthesis